MVLQCFIRMQLHNLTSFNSFCLFILMSIQLQIPSKNLITDLIGFGAQPGGSLTFSLLTLLIFTFNHHTI
ncbi:hypothetical protein V8C40DRAFT_247073 [Trichoderma camerunense]